MHEKVAVIVLFMTAALLPACAGPPRPQRAPEHPARRIVTLMPSFAQDLCAIGAGGEIAGVSAFGRSAGCAPNAPEVGNFASIDAEKIVALHPDAVVAIPAQRALAAPLSRAGIRTVFLRDDSYADIFADIRQIGRLDGRTRAAERVVERLKRRTRALRASEHFARRPRVFVVLQAQPIWTVGPTSYISALLRLAGARNAVASLPRPYAQYSAEALLRLQPDAIIAGSDTHIASLLGREPWRSLRAVREKHVYVLQDPSLLEQPGPHYNEGISWLIERLRPLTT